MSANQNNSWSAKLMFQTRLRYEYFGYDCAFTRKRLRACKLISIFCSELSRTLLGGDHKLLVSYTKVNAINLFQTPHVLCITDDHFYFVQNIDD